MPREPELPQEEVPVTVSEWLLALSTIFWCQALPQRTLTIYAIFVALTAVGKFLWSRYL